MAVSKEMCELIQEVGLLADREWREHGPYIAGETAYKHVHYMSVKMCHPAYPIFMYELGSMPALSNGVCVDLWGSNDPVVFPSINVTNISKIAKSQKYQKSQKSQKPPNISKISKVSKNNNNLKNP